jgi:hypothetical protein
VGLPLIWAITAAWSLSLSVVIGAALLRGTPTTRSARPTSLASRDASRVFVARGRSAWIDVGISRIAGDTVVNHSEVAILEIPKYIHAMRPRSRKPREASRLARHHSSGISLGLLVKRGDINGLSLLRGGCNQVRPSPSFVPHRHPEHEVSDIASNYHREY